MSLLSFEQGCKTKSDPNLSYYPQVKPTVSCVCDPKLPPRSSPSPQTFFIKPSPDLFQYLENLSVVKSSKEHSSCVKASTTRLIIHVSIREQVMFERFLSYDF